MELMTEHPHVCRGSDPWRPPWDSHRPAEDRHCTLSAAHAAVGHLERSLAMIVRDLMSGDVRTCTPQDSLQRAAEIMWSQDCGVVPVIDGERRVVGMVTDRDVCMHALMSGRPLRDCLVADAMSDDVCACGASDSLAHAQALMRGRRVRRLPVVGDDRQLVGILSLNDLAIRTGHAGRDNGVAPEAVAATLTGVSLHGRVAQES